jgi:hypothetical protein
MLEELDFQIRILALSAIVATALMEGTEFSTVSIW